MNRLLVIGFVICSLAMNTVHGENVSEDSLPVYYLDEVVITATRYNMALKDLSATRWRTN